MLNRNNHLNLFKFFNESDQKQFIENNLSRAFAICLQNNALLLSEFIRNIVDHNEYHYLFNIVESDSRCHIDIQINMSKIEIEGYKTVYAVALTTYRNLDLSDFMNQKQTAKESITDIFISIKDIAFVIEIKKHEENCKEQLYNQIIPFTQFNKSKNPVKILAKNYPWQNVTKLIENARNIQKLTFQHTIFLDDFLELVERRFPDWFEPKPFSTLPIYSHEELYKRMNQALSYLTKALGDKYQILHYGDRFGISVPFVWAQEVLVAFDQEQENIVFYIYPGNTKQQGYPIFNKSLDWENKKTLSVNGKDYKLEIKHAIKLCHFNKYISGIDFWKNDITKPIYTLHNFLHKSGKWHRDSWNELEIFFDGHFNPTFDWRSKCSWKHQFLDSDRSYLTMSLGYICALSIPYSELTSIDKQDGDIHNVSNFLQNIIMALGNITN